MIEYLTEHAGFVALVVFVLYALTIYKGVEILKYVANRYEWLKPYRVSFAAIIGLVTGPLVYPWLIKAMGVDFELPWYVATIMGVGTGTTAVNIYEWVDRKTSGEDCDQ